MLAYDYLEQFLFILIMIILKKILLSLSVKNIAVNYCHLTILTIKPTLLKMGKDNGVVLVWV